MSLEDGAMIEPLAVAVHAVTSVGKLRGNQSELLRYCFDITHEAHKYT